MSVFPRLSDSVRRKPVSTAVRLVGVCVAFVLFREVAQGFLDGMIAGFTDGV